MKKSIFSAIFLCVISFCEAQDHKLELGLEGGPNTSDIYSSSMLIDVGPAYHYSIGLTGQFNINKTFSIKSGVGFESKGFIQVFSFVKDPASSNPFYTTFNPFDMDYLIVPIQLKATFGKKIKFFADAGPYFGFMVGAKTTISGLDSSGNKYTYEDNDMIKNYKHFDFGAGVGIGLEKEIFSMLIIDLEARLNYGFLNNGYPFSFNPSVENESANLLIGFRYKI